MSSFRKLPRLIFTATVLSVVLFASHSARGAWLQDSKFQEGWTLGPGWTRVTTDSTQLMLGGDRKGAATIWRQGWTLQPVWTVDVDVIVDELYGNATPDCDGLAGLVLADNAAQPKTIVEATIEHRSFKITRVMVTDPVNSARSLLREWRPGGDTRFHLQLKREAGQKYMTVSVTGNQGLVYHMRTPETDSAALDRLKTIGLKVHASRARFANLVVGTDSKASGKYQALAESAVSDMLGHFWIGDTSTGQIANTWYGFPAAELPDPRGGLWERGAFLIVLENLYRATGDPIVRQRVVADWNRTKRVYKPEEFEYVGRDPNPGCDDSGWNAWMLLVIHRTTGDKDALAHAKALVANAFNRWTDDQLGGGMWYNDKKEFKSLYQVGLVVDALHIYELTGDKAFLKRAQGSYDWMEKTLLRHDNLYWSDYDKAGHRGKENPEEIREGGSVSFLGGNMMMGVIHAQLYRITKDKKYLERAQRTAEAIARRMTDGHGVLVNDRDAWADGTFVGEWATQVLTLPGITPKAAQLLRATAESIHARARTPDGYYGGCWSGPADGPGAIWSAQGSRPQQIHTCANSVNMIVAAALLDTAAKKQNAE